MDHTGPTVHYVSFLEDDKIPKQIPSNENCKHSSTGWVPITTQMFSNIHQNHRVFPSEINSNLSLNYIISTNTFTQADTLHITYSITLLLLRSWERRRLTNWSQDKKKKKKKKHALRVKKGTTQDWANFLILWYLLASMTPRKWKVSRRNTEKNAFLIPYGFNALSSQCGLILD